MARLSIRLFGPLQVTLDGKEATSFASDKTRALLAYLVVEADHPHRRESLASLLWPDYPERSARTNLRGALADLRRVSGDRDADPSYLDISRHTIQFNSASDAWCDVVAFTRCLEAQEPSQHSLEEAVQVYRGGFLEGFSLPDSPTFEEWSRLTHERCHLLVTDALRRLAACYEGRGD